jgi:hypothetical protein
VLSSSDEAEDFEIKTVNHSQVSPSVKKLLLSTPATDKKRDTEEPSYIRPY